MAEYTCGCVAAGDLVAAHCPMHGEPERDNPGGGTMTKHDDDLLPDAEKVVAPREGTGGRPPCETCDHWWPTKGDFGDCHGGLPVLAPALSAAEGLPSNIGWWPATHKSDGCAQHQDFYLQFARKGAS